MFGSHRQDGIKGGIEADIASINRMLEAFPSDATLDKKREAMAHYAEESICGKTFAISYVGKMDWCGLDRYFEDLHAYIGEKHTKNICNIIVP